MKASRLVKVLIGAMGLWGWWAIYPSHVAAHWDSLVGLMGQDALRALETGHAEDIVKWARLEDESKVRAALQKTISLRTRYPEHIAILDRAFFGTLLTIRWDGDRADRARAAAAALPPGPDDKLN